jgi:hypothetical protein
MKVPGAASVDVNVEEVTTRAFDALERTPTDVIRVKGGEFKDLFIGTLMQIVFEATLSKHCSCITLIDNRE